MLKLISFSLGLKLLRFDNNPLFSMEHDMILCLIRVNVGQIKGVQGEDDIFGLALVINHEVVSPLAKETNGTQTNNKGQRLSAELRWYRFHIEWELYFI